MKNLGSIVLLLAAGAGYVASLPAGGVAGNQIRAVHDGAAAPMMIPRAPKKGDAQGAGAASE